MKQLFYEKINIYNRIQYAVGAVQQWLNLRLQLLGVVVTSAVAFIAVYLHFYHLENVNSGLIGLSLVYSLSLTALLNGTVQTFTQTELDLISVERIMQILNGIELNYNTDSECQSSAPACPPDNWRAVGALRFENVSMRYREDHDLVLKDICFQIDPGEHIAIVGMLCL